MVWSVLEHAVHADSRVLSERVVDCLGCVRIAKLRRGIAQWKTDLINVGAGLDRKKYIPIGHGRSASHTTGTGESKGVSTIRERADHPGNAGDRVVNVVSVDQIDWELPKLFNIHGRTDRGPIGLHFPMRPSLYLMRLSKESFAVWERATRTGSMEPAKVTIPLDVSK
jgi:hypothetical protein